MRVTLPLTLAGWHLPGCAGVVCGSMKHSRHTDEEIAQLLREAQAGISIDAICRSADVSLRTFYRWRKRLGGLAPPAVDRLQSLESENRRLLRQIKKLKAERNPVATAGGSGTWQPRSECGLPGEARPSGDRADAPQATRSGASFGRFSHVRTGR